MAEFPDYVPPTEEIPPVAVTKKRQMRSDEEKRALIEQVNERRVNGEEILAVCADLGISPSNYQRWKTLAKGKPKPKTGGDPRSKRYTEAEKKKILARFDKHVEKMGVTEAAVKTGVNLNTIRTWQGYVPPSRVASSGKRKGRRATSEEREEILASVAALTNADAGAQVGVSGDTIRKWRIKHGIPVPTKVTGVLLPARRVQGPTDGSIRPAPPMPVAGLVGRMTALEAEIAELRALILG